MAELVFVKEGTKWVSTFEATSDFNLHIERDKGGFLFVSQRTTQSGEYDSTKDADFSGSDLIIDYDFSALVYPKYIKVSCATEPTSGIVTSDGEITEIKAQTKEVEITSNGTTEVTPDAGFAYLNSVKVKTNVPTQGGEGGGSASSMEYFLAEELLDLVGFASVIKLHNEEENYMRIVPASAWATDEMNKSTLVAVGLDLQSEYIGPEPFNGKLLDIFVKLGGTKEALAAIPRITKEEFYSLNNTPA